MSEIRYPASYSQHGDRHGPHDSDPSSNGPWWDVADTAYTAWAAGSYSPGDQVSDQGFNWECVVATDREPDLTVDFPGGTYWEMIASYFQNGAVNTGDGTPGSDDLTSFRLNVGKGEQIRMNFEGVAEGDIVFALPPGYFTGGKQSVPMVDDNGDPACVTIVLRDDDTGAADVYAGRV